MRRKIRMMRWFQVVVLAFALLMAGALGFGLGPVTGQSGTTNFTNLDVRRDLAVGDDLTVADDAVMGGMMNLAAQSAISLTMNGYFTPTGAFQPVESAGAVSVSGANFAPGVPGDLLIVVNIGGSTITFTETTGLISAGNVALGTLDSATFVYHGTNWYQIGASNN